MVEKTIVTTSGRWSNAESTTQPQIQVSRNWTSRSVSVTVETEVTRRGERVTQINDRLRGQVSGRDLSTK